MGKNTAGLTWGRFFARELQHADFSWVSHLSYQLDHPLDSGCDFGDPRKPILARFREGLPSRLGAYPAAAIRGRNVPGVVAIQETV